MQTTETTNQRIKALAVQATEIRQTSDHCSGHSETWSEINLDTFTRVLVEECAKAITQYEVGGKHKQLNANTLKATLLEHFGFQ